MTRSFVNTVILIGLLSIPAMAQNPATKPALSPSQAVLASWNDIGRKLIAMAADFPEDKYDFKPVPVQRNFGCCGQRFAEGRNDYVHERKRDHPR
jgi:hypothetical protein